MRGSIETARNDRVILEGRNETLAKEVGVLVDQEEVARRQIEAATHAQREIAAKKDALAKTQRDIAQREEALTAETSAHTDGIAAGERILDLLSDDVIDYDPSAKKWKPAQNWDTSGIDGAEMRETIRLLPKPLLRFISKTITVVKSILDRERAKIDREWEDVRNAAHTVAEARERLGLEEDLVIFDLTTNPCQRDGF